ncbi:SIR2 family NAD-dependent protein deacylase [Verrucomicrobiota bacterium sgz303538]
MPEKKKHLVILSGAGISAESGLSTFRGMGGMWEKYRFEEVASPDAWARDPELVMRFYNERRKAALAAEPNAGHRACVELERGFDVTVITQNVDDLHERAGSSNVVHLHGELMKSRSTADPSIVYPIKGWELKIGDRCELGSQLRPHIVWFGEDVPMIEQARAITLTADLFVVVGTSLQVYPAAGLLEYVPSSAPICLIDPDPPKVPAGRVHIITDSAARGLPILAQALLASL